MNSARFFLFLSLCLTPALCADSPRFRGPNGDGTFAESGLLKKWADGGPELLWKMEDMGTSYSSVSVAGNVVYTTGKIGEEGFVFAIDTKGKLVWKSSYGPETKGGNYEGARSTPAIGKNHLYLMSGFGVVSCFDLTQGQLQWSVDTLERFAKGQEKDALIPHFSFSESPLLDGNRLICTPGAPGGSVVALDPANGKTIWISKGIGDPASYCSVRVYERGNVRQLVTVVKKHIIGLNPESGEVIWKTPIETKYDVHANSPLFYEDMIYVSDGYKKGGLMFKIAEDGSSISKLWAEPELDIHHGGGVLVDGKIYGAATKGGWYALDAKTGKIMASGPGVGKGSAIYADGLIYGYGEKGLLGIIDPNSPGLEPISSFKVTYGSGPHWGHPTISNGNLYIHHGNALMCYRIKADSI